MKSKQLQKVIDAIENVPGWLRTLEMIWGKEVGDFSESYHDKKINSLHQSEQWYKKVEQPRVLDLLKEFKEDNKEFSNECKERRRRERIKLFEAKKSELENILEHRGEIEKKEKLYKEVANLHKAINCNLSDEQIENARNYPIEKLVEIRNNFAICPFHKDSNPSLYCKNNFYYCFTCNAKGSVIDLYMNLHGCDFKTAVQALSSI